MEMFFFSFLPESTMRYSIAENVSPAAGCKGGGMLSPVARNQALVSHKFTEEREAVSALKHVV